MKNGRFTSSLVLILFAGASFAGLSREVPVEIDYAEGLARGSQITAKTSANDVEYIGCGTRRFSDAGNSFRLGFCQAGDANGNEIVCFTQDPDLIDEMRANSTYGFILFRWRDDGQGGAMCTNVGFSNQSIYLPEKKVK